MRLICSLLGILSICITLNAQSISYEFAAPNAAHHEAEISVTATRLPAEPAFFRMSRSSPGRYATHEFGKNVYNVKAFDGAGKTIPVEKADGDVYKVTGHNGTVKLTYTLFGNYADGTYVSVDKAGYHLNMPSTFMWVKGMEKAPVTFHFAVPDKNWQIATQLKPSPDPFTFTATDLQYMMDSPVKIGTLNIKEWKVTNADKKQYTFRLALEADAPDTMAQNFAGKVARVVQQAQAVYGELPSYDYGTYTFLASINPYVNGDGMEHRNSTMISIPVAFDGSDRLLGVFSHEFFHCWNVERIRPYQLEPFNFEKSNMTDGLWVAEGFTQYYGSLILQRAGFTDENDFLSAMSGLINTKMNSAGAQNYTPIENSQRAVFVDAGVSVDKTNYPNMYSSYYTYGGAIALALDLDLRSHYPGKSLDNFMRELWKRFGKTEKSYTIPDLQDALASITDKNYASGFFSSYVYGHEPFDYNKPLKFAGLQLVPANKGVAWAGQISFASGRSELTLQSGTIKNTPWYNAGLDANDIIVSIDGTAVTQKKDVDDVFSLHKPGDNMPLVYKHRGKKIESQLQLSESPAIQIKPLETFAIDKKTEAFKRNWLGDKTLSPAVQKNKDFDRPENTAQGY